MSEDAATDRIISPDAAGLARAAEALRGGRLVGMPTETVYGLACNALDARAVARVFEAKARPSFDPLIVHVADAGAAWQLAAEVPESARRLAQAFWPGPLTLVIRKRDTIGDLVTSGLPTVGLRVPGHPAAGALIEAAGVPVAAPSANRFGGVSPTRASHVVGELGDAVDVVLDGGPCRTGVESTVVSLLTDVPTVLRLGGTTVEAIEAVVGEVWLSLGGGEEDAQAGRASPGMLDRHYAPRTPMRLVDDAAGLRPGADAVRTGVLAYSADCPDQTVWGDWAVLSPTGDLREAAANLFAVLRGLDERGLDRLIAERVPDEGLGRAINDRLRRASGHATRAE